MLLQLQWYITMGGILLWRMKGKLLLVLVCKGQVRCWVSAQVMQSGRGKAASGGKVLHISRMDKGISVFI